MTTTLARTFAALSAINEAILYAKSPDELYQKVCDAGFSSGRLYGGRRVPRGAGRSAAALCALVAAMTWRGCVRSRSPRRPARRRDRAWAAKRSQPEALHQQRLPERSSLAGVARGRGGGRRRRSRGATPDLHGGAVSGCCMSRGREPARSTRRWSRCSSGCRPISLTRWTISRAREPAWMASGQCGGSTACSARSVRRTKQFCKPAPSWTCISGSATPLCIAANRLPPSFCCTRPDSEWLTPVAATGHNLDLIRQSRYSIDPENPYGKGISGEVFRTQKAIVEDDLVNRTKGTLLGAGQRQCRRRRLRGCSLDQAWHQHRRAVFLREQSLGERRRHRRIVAAHDRKRVLCAREFRPRQGEGSDRPGGGTAGAHVRGAKRDQ